MRSFFSQSSLFAVALSSLFLTACSSTPSTNDNVKDVIDYDADTDYRDTEKSLSQTLDMPPNLFAPSRNRDDFHSAINNAKNPEDGYRFVPTYRADNVRVESNLSERWLVVTGMTSEQVWEGTQAFLVSLGMPIKEKRKDIGMIRTEFIPRTELVPLDDQGPLTRLLNSWRPELAEGVYDRLIARVEYDEEDKLTRVYFHHYMVFDPSVAEEDEQAVTVGDGWRIKPYNPIIEAEALYQSMIFFGSTQSQALKDVQITEAEVETVGDEKVFGGLIFAATEDETLGYLQAMIYRSGWTMDRMKPSTKEVWVQVPKDARKDSSLSASLAFWRSDDEQEKYIPEVVRFQVSENDKAEPGEESSLLTVSSQEGETPLTPEKREYIFQSLGLMAK